MDFKTIKEIDNKYYMKTFNRIPLDFVCGKGTKLYDSRNKEYTDFFSGIAVNCLGHADRELVQSISVQAAKLMHVSNIFYTEEQAELINAIMDGSDFDRIFLCNSGAEANEALIKLIRKYFYNYGGRRNIILTAHNSFHGRTLATITATGQSKYSEPFAPLLEGFEYVTYNDLNELSQQLKRPSIAALLIETIQGEGGVNVADADYLKKAYRMCKENGVLFCIDEIQTGMGRTGKMFSYEHFGVLPDIISLAKGLGGGFPIGAILARGDVAESFSPGDHGTTFGGNALACKAATVVVNRLKKTNLLESVIQNGNYFLDKLKEIVKACPHAAVQARGMGLLLGLQLKEEIKASDIMLKLLSSGFVTNACGNNTLRFAPPFIITKKEIDNLTAAIKDILK